MKLNEFRLETYEERFTLMCALEELRKRERDPLDRVYQGAHKRSVEALLLRLSRTRCQPGGCSYCDGSEEGDQ